MSCGQAHDAELFARHDGVQHNIVAGTRTALPHFEATGALLVATQLGAGPVHTQLCTATLIAPDYVITAAHCQPLKAHMGAWDKGAPLLQSAVNALSVSSDTYDRGLRGSSRPQQSRQVWYAFCLRDEVSPKLGVSQQGDARCIPGTQFFVHPRYQLPGPWDEGLVDAHDVAVMRLAASITYVAPAVLPSDDAPVVLQSGQQVSIAGFGSTQDHAAIGPAAQASGVKRYAASAIGQVSAAEMTIGEPPCAAHKSFGDSGGPTLLQTPQGPRLVGVTSRLLTDTDAAMGTVDTRIDAVSAWVRDVAGMGSEDYEEEVEDQARQDSGLADIVSHKQSNEAL